MGPDTPSQSSSEALSGVFLSYPVALYSLSPKRLLTALRSLC